MLRRSFLRLVAAGSACSAGSYFPVTSKAQAAIPGTVTWGGAYLLDDQTNDMPHTKTALSLNSSSSPTGQSVNSAILEAIRNSDWPAAGIDLRTGLKRKITRYGMSFGLARESVLQNGYRPLRDKTVFSLRLIGYNTIFDFQERRIISAFAVRGRYFQALKGRVGEDALPQLFFDLLANRDNSGSIARFMTDLALDYEYEIKYRGKNFRYVETVVSPFASKAAVNHDVLQSDSPLGRRRVRRGHAGRRRRLGRRRRRPLGPRPRRGPQLGRRDLDDAGRPRRGARGARLRLVVAAPKVPRVHPHLHRSA